MKSLFYLLKIETNFYAYKPVLLCLVTAFVVTIITIPPLINLFKRFRLLDAPNERKIHSNPIPTMGGIAIMAGMTSALFFWFPFNNDVFQVCFFLSIVILFSLGIMDDLRDLSARYKFITQIGLATLIALSGVRITSFNGLFGIEELPLLTQYTFTVIVIVGITNAFNLIDGIDGLAGGLGFMSLVVLGTFLMLSDDKSGSLLAFSLAGGLLAFLYFNFNPAKIFMGDTGSLVLGFIVAVLGIRLMQANLVTTKPILLNAPIFVLGIVLIPVFDAVRVFSIRIWNGESPFTPGKIHIHHLLTNEGISHASAAKLMYCLHGFILMESFWLQQIRGEFTLILLTVFMLLVIGVFKNINLLLKKPAFAFLRSILKAD